MIARLLLLMLVAVPFAGTLQGAEVWSSVKNFFFKPACPLPPMVRVLVAEDEPCLEFKVNGQYKMYDPNTGSIILGRKMGKCGVMETIPEGLKWGEEFPGVYQLLIVPENMGITTEINGNEYRGSIYVYNVEGCLNIVNRVDLEDFLVSILAPKYQSPAEDEYLSAIAIANRTYAYFFAENSPNRFWSINAKDVNYNGHYEPEEETEIVQAIHNTKYMVMSKTGAYEGGVTAFPAQWKTSEGSSAKGVSSRITLFDAERLANKGDNAAQILFKAFPNTTIQLIYRGR